MQPFAASFTKWKLHWGKRMKKLMRSNKLTLLKYINGYHDKHKFSDWEFTYSSKQLEFFILMYIISAQCTQEFQNFGELDSVSQTRFTQKSNRSIPNKNWKVNNPASYTFGLSSAFTFLTALERSTRTHEQRENIE